MSKRVLYRCYESNKLNDIIVCRSNMCIIASEPKLHYGELPQTHTVTYTVADGLHLLSLLNTVDYFSGIWTTEPIFKGKKKMDKLTDYNLRYIPINEECIKKMKWENFKKITKTYEYIVDPDADKFSLAQLMKTLSANEFIEYCKDRGLNVLPIVK